MPVYLLHGFRWPRPLIRIHIILQNLEDAAAEWLIAPNTTHCLLENLNELHPEQMKNLPHLRFVEQYDPEDEETKDQPYAYIADTVHEIKLGVALEEVTSGGISNEVWESIIELRDKLCPDQKVGWFVVVCGDEERFYPPSPTATPSRDSIRSDRSTVTESTYHKSHASSKRSDSVNGVENEATRGNTQTRARSKSLGRSLRRMFGGGSKETIPKADKNAKNLPSARGKATVPSSSSTQSLGAGVSGRPETGSRRPGAKVGVHPPLPGTAQ